MGFLHQLHLLLWKNVTLKRRGPWVLAFEIFIPLVLFFILLGLRQKKPAIPVKEVSFYTTAPLTSAGIIPIMQSLCPDGQRDEFGFLQYKNSTVTQLLERISEVVEQNHLFTSDRPSLGEELESLQQHLESLSSAQGPLESHYDTSHGFTVGSVLRNQSMFQQFLIRNLSLPNDTASLLLSSPINLKEVYNLIFGMYPKVGSKVGEKDEGQHELHSPGEKLVQLEKQLLGGWRSLDGGLIQKVLRDPTKAARRQALLKVLSQALGITGGGGGQKFDPQALREVEGILLTGAVLETLTCGEGGNSEMSKILLVPEKQEAVLQAYRTTVCGGRAEQRAELFKEMSEELRDQIDTQRVCDELSLEQSNMSGLLDQSHLGALLKNLADVERLLRDVDLLSGLARLLPKGACAGHLPPPIANTTSWSSNTTTWGLNTTDSPVEEGGRAAGNEADAENPRSQFSAFVQLWAGLQPILCGNNRIIEPEALKQGNMSSLGFTSKEQRNLGLLVHLVTTNPKILYSPIGSEVDKVIQKANETFAFVGNVTHYARVWLNISAELRAFLEEGKLHNHLMWLQQFIADLKRHHDLLNVSDSELMNSLLEENFTLPNTTTLLEQLHTIDNAACGWTNFMSKVSVDIFRGFPDEESIVNYTLNQAYQDNVSVFASVIFQTNKDGSLPPHVMYKIRQNSSFTEKTNEIRRAYWRPGPNTGGKFYFLYGFVWIQDMIERAIINTFVGHDVVEPGNYVQMFPYPCYTRDDFLFVIEHMMPLCMVISWVYSVAMMIQHIVAEKEERLFREVMKMMGLNNAVHWVAWFITGFVQLSISVTALTAILKYGKVLLHSDPFIIWLFLTIYAVATIMFCFLVSVLYSKAKLASACGGIIYFLSYVPYMYVAIREEVAHDKITAFEKCIASLMSTTAFGLGSKYFALYEVAGVGIQWRTINQSPVEGDDFNLLLSMVMLTIDAIVYGVLTWYIEAVHPGMYGLPRPWYFPLQKSYWLGSGRIETWERPWGGGTRLSVMEEDQACAMEHRRSEETRGIEEEPSHLPLVVCIDKLTKVYKTGSKLALNKLSLNLHENQVVSFLGHNGAGKTTTMSILTGLFPPTSGSATIYGHDIRTEMERIRQNLGMCPQHNVLFDKLSVEEHLWFYSRLKGMAEEDIRKEMDKMIEDLELSNKRHSLVQTLSGGMKRKLSVAIAFVGGSRAVILDEPTAGVDPYARRAIWDLILKYKQGRTILLSTHHMDEADLLGDRIAIISHGKLKCCGSPLFLKSTYGDGYKLTLVKKQSDSHTAGDLPPLILSPSQYHNYTQPRGNFILYANEDRLQYRSKRSPDASPQRIVNTLRSPSGVGATCVLKTPFNSTLDQLAQSLNPYANNSKTLAARYFDSMCLDSFTQGVPLSNFVPPPPSPAPSDDPDAHFEDGLWNYTAAPPTTVREMATSPPTLPLSIREPVRCICSMQGTGFSCPSGVGGRPPLMKVVTGDILVDITGRNVSEYLLYTSDRLRLHRYGGFTVGNIQKSVPASFGRKTPPMVRKIAVRRSSQVLYNNKGYHSMPTYLNVLNNAILRANLPSSKGNPAAYGITVTNHPMNRTSASLSLDYLLQGTDVVIAIFIIVAMSFVPASFVVFLVAEKSTKAKHLQFVSGCDPVTYWLANYIWDMLNYLVPATCCVLILFVFDLPAYTSPTNFPAVLSLFLLYGWSITPIMYPASFWFEVPSTAYVFLIVINLFIGITATVATFLLQLFERDKDLKLVNSYLKSCFLIFPNYNLGHGLMEMAYNEYINEYYAKIGQFDKVKSPFEWDIVTRGLVAMTIEGFVGFLITILCQYNFLRKAQRMPVNSQPVEDDDVDVACERRRVLRGDADNDMLKIDNLTKVYKSRKMGRILAVDRLCLGVRPGECFGLLGVNGAGKTTTFKMLTGDESTTGGEAFIQGHSILRELLCLQQSIGYCPQFDALFDDLTAREHLELYTRLRGIPWKDEERVVRWALEKLELSKYADKPAGTYSGGNKRKLSTAIALIGYPSLIFLDEPTTGMDPKARRFLWNLILDIIKTGRSVVLTSHSMEECEALCTRLGIMVNGRFKCLGSIQHLKNRFGDGYMITVRTKTTTSIKEVIRFFNRNFPEAVLKERHHTKIQYQLKSENISLAQVFSKMEQVVEVLSIEDYSVSQTTLDNVFVNFAKKQSDNLEQQESSPSSAGQSPLQRLLSILRPCPTNTELNALVREEPEELESDDDDEGLISFEEERVQLSFNTDTLC
ncbi:ATP-binding cassette sub-family A member 2-like [Sinocyclocheilus anshuiensis]|uniref:ATP-binding cassette sub-family A member 2-like n=1 Tax=Sinocyclocheilus anshuiensis TaxID=1608454 RepID=UPI0007B92D6D|nr:PREDICTED: ATP-binding cassette sub-family A member 2-like [Sinocyclocheilus anshuiensis]